MKKDQCTALIERLADGIAIQISKKKPALKKDSFGYFSPIRIGNVLEKMTIQRCSAEDMLKLLAVWNLCHFSFSLQTILEESEWEECNGERWHWECNRDCQLWMLKSPAKELFLFLDQLFPA